MNANFILFYSFRFESLSNFLRNCTNQNFLIKKVDGSTFDPKGWGGGGRGQVARKRVTKKEIEREKGVSKYIKKISERDREK